MLKRIFLRIGKIFNQRAGGSQRKLSGMIVFDCGFAEMEFEDFTGVGIFKRVLLYLGNGKIGVRVIGGELLSVICDDFTRRNPGNFFKQAKPYMRKFVQTEFACLSVESVR